MFTSQMDGKPLGNAALRSLHSAGTTHGCLEDIGLGASPMHLEGACTFKTVQTCSACTNDCLGGITSGMWSEEHRYRLVKTTRGQPLVSIMQDWHNELVRTIRFTGDLEP